MSEIGYFRGDLFDTPLAPPEKARPSFGTRAMRAIGKFTLEATIMSAVVSAAGGGLGMAMDDDPLLAAKNLTVFIQEGFASCDPLPAAEVGRLEQRLEAGLAAKKAPNLPGPAPRMQDYGLHAVDAKEVTGQIGSVTRPERGVELADEFTQRTYNFTIESYHRSTSEADRKDTQELVARIGELPLELMKAVTANDLDKIVVGQPDEGESHAFYSSPTAKIRIMSGQTASIGHELGHAIRRTASRQSCTLPTISEVPDFERVNPPGFSYGKSAWEGITFTQYASEKVKEDYATTVGELLGTKDPAIACLAGDDKVILREKLAIAATDIERIAPGSGTYFIDKTAARSIC
jgi:hypothetical protein